MNIGIRALGKYQLREQLGRGGMAEVWKAFDTSLHRYVAIKLMHANLRNDPEFVIRFEREARAIASLRHPNIVRLHDFQIADTSELENPVAYMVMEYIAGQTLTSYIHSTSRVGKFPSPAEVIHLFSGISSAIDYAHQNGMIHRDIKPANILLDLERPSRSQMGEPILTDFGIVKLMGSATATLSGMWIGTPLYMSPEQAQGHAGDERSDIYALGVILYEIFTGMPPFQGENPVAIIMQQISTMPMAPDLINPNIPPALSRVILRGLAKRPEERFPSATAMTAALAEALKISSTLRSLPDATSSMSESAFVSPFQTTIMPNRPQTVQVDTTSGQKLLERPSMPKPTLRSKRALIALAALLLLLLGGSGLGAFYALSHQRAANPVIALVGHAYFLSSAQPQDVYGQGINDELQIELHNIPDPASGKSYYAWLLSDKNVSPQVSILLGKLIVDHGNVQFLYAGDTQHSNLIGSTSRLLITEEAANTVPKSPSADQTTWRYYAELPQTPDAVGIHQRTIDIIRDILYYAAKLQTSLQGGIDIHFLNNVRKVLEWANSSRDAQQIGNTVILHNQAVRILDYLDGVSLVGKDVPTGPSVLVDPTLAQVPLIDFQPNQELVSYVDRMNNDLTALFNRPDATTHIQQLAQQADDALLDNVQGWLEQVRQYARQLVGMSRTQLLLPSTLSIVNNMVNQANNAYNGQSNPAGGQILGGAVWIHTHDQQLATFDINTYAASSTNLK